MMNQAVRHLLKSSGVKFVRILWCDNANLIRAKAPHIDFAAGLEGVGISAAQQAIPVMYDAVAANSGLGPVGEVQLVPDWSTLNLLPYAPSHAQVMGDMLLGGEAWAHCPRAFLREQVERLKAHGLELKAAFENEFVLLQDAAPTPVDSTGFAMTGAMNRSAAVIDAITDALLTQGVEIDYYYPESAPGQQELSVRYTDALGAADRQIVFRETVRGVAAQFGLIASFMPKLFEEAAGSGCHLNLSLWREESNVTGDTEHPSSLSAEARAFVAGILAHASALTAVTLPTTNSFRRIRPHFWAGAFRTWGRDNREAAVRVVGGPEGASRLELKTVDAAANPYLALAAVLAVGLAGLEQHLPLPDEVTLDPALIPEQERQKRGIERLPETFGEALAVLEADEVLLSALGEARAKAYLAVKRAEWAAMQDMNLAEEVALLLERY